MNLTIRWPQHGDRTLVLPPRSAEWADLVADLVGIGIGWLLLRTAAAALARQSDPSLLKTADADLAGSVAAGRWFARQVLPHLTAELVAARLLDEEPLLLPDASL